MGTKMGFPPGVRIQLRDNSAYTVVENPATTAGIVGFASKGELNKIIPVNTTAEQDSKLGYGYQSYKYNQGMYAARAVLDAGGVVEFVRPYGEEIDRTDPRKRDLKTDTFVVAFDKNAGKYKCEANQTSFQIEHFAATRYKTDGAAAYGVTRKINNISEAVSSGKNVDFGLTASEDYADSNKARKWDGEHCTDMVLFAIMNRDPSYAYRAYDRFEVVGEPDYGTDRTTVQVNLSTVPTFTIGDEVLIPASGNKNNTKDTLAEVTDIEDKTVTLSVDPDFTSTGKQNFTAIIFSNPDTAIEDGFDYMNIKTAVAGQGVKKFSAAKWGSDLSKTPNDIVIGDCFTIKNKNGNDVDIRLWKAIEKLQDTVPVVDGSNLLIQCKDLKIEVGDTLSLKFVKTVEGEKQVDLFTDLYVKDIKNGTTAVVALPTGYDPAELDGDVYVAITECSEAVLYADVTDADTWEKVAAAVVKVLNGSALGFAKAGIVNNITSASGTSIVIDSGAAFDYSIGDKVAIVRASKTIDTTEASDKAPDSFFTGDSIVSSVLTVVDINTFTGVITVNDALNIVIPTPQDDPENPVPAADYQLINLTTTSATAYNAVTSETYRDYDDGVETTLSFTEGEVDAGAEYSKEFTDVTISPAEGYTNVKVGTVTTVYDGETPSSYNITVDLVANTDGETYHPIVTVTNTGDATLPLAGKLTVKATVVSYRDLYRDTVDTYIVSSYTMYVSSIEQKENIIVLDGDVAEAGYVKTDAKWNLDVEKSKKVLADSDIGATFLGLGLAKTDYLDIDFDNNPRQVYVLTDEGINIARMYLSIRYRFNGKIYEFDGTIVPYSTATKVQLGIKYSADYELTDSGLEFVLNDSGVLDYFLENSSYDLSQSLVGGTLNGSVTAIAYNNEDPAIKNDAVWTYNPLNNRSGSTLSTVWNLFLNKDGSDVDMLVAAGMAINNPFMNKIETLNTQVMQAMLNVCEARKDCFALFDGVSEPDIAKALKKDIAATGFVSTLGRWGMLYDGRGLVQDSVYTNGEAEIMKSIQLASIITGNRQSGIYWIPPSGYDQAPVPAAWGTKEKYGRTYNSEDKNCDVGKLSDIHVNATRVNREGMFIWGDFTLQMEDTAFNQAHVAMLVAGIHKSFYKYLDHKVFRLNTPALRAQITSDLQDKLNMIKRSNPQGLIDGLVICDDSNNTRELIDQNFLIVDLRLLPPKSARWIILRTSVESTKNGNTISTEIISG